MRLNKRISSSIMRAAFISSNYELIHKRVQQERGRESQTTRAPDTRAPLPVVSLGTTRNMYLAVPPHLGLPTRLPLCCDCRRRWNLLLRSCHESNPDGARGSPAQRTAYEHAGYFQGTHALFNTMLHTPILEVLVSAYGVVLSNDPH